MHLIKGSSLRHSQKGKVKPTTSKETIEGGENSPTRDSIIERLLRFFRSRPSVDQLKERGIYRPEPIFGSTLAAICLHDHTNVPRFITEITRVVEDKGLGVDGIYRVSGNLSSIQKIRCQVDQDRYEVLWKEDDIHVLTGAVKLFFRELSEPIFPISLNKEFMFAIRHTHAKTKLKAIDDLLNKLPLVHKETLRVLILHLLKVAGNSVKNRMTIHGLAICFGPALFSSDDKPSTNGRLNGTVDKKNVAKKSKEKPNDRKGLISSNDNTMSSEPNQILAYKMIVYGQIVEFILTEFNKLSIFIPSNGTNNI
uniref:Rho-GAP domain-containing protein n=1 Tax=Panagrolaimus davidi TaxID=227884 RepID=A0A914PZ43_9BILA